jgi:hypothetical protein
MPDIGAAGLSPAVAKGNLPQPGRYLFGGQDLNLIAIFSR